MVSAEELSFRRATAADRDWLFALHERAMRSMVERTFGPWDAAAQRAKFDSRTETDIRILLKGTEPVGALHLEDAPDGSVRLGLIEIDPAFQNRGLGGAALRRLAEEAAASGRAVTLRVRRTNRAKRLYERVGFRPAGSTDTHFHLRLEVTAEDAGGSIRPEVP